MVVRVVHWYKVAVVVYRVLKTEHSVWVVALCSEQVFPLSIVVAIPH